MARTNSASQGDRAGAGADLEIFIVRHLDRALERAGIDEDFKILGRRRRDGPKLSPLAYRLPGATLDSYLRPDFAIKHCKSNQFSAFGGAKVSCKDRIIQDLHIARELKTLFPNIFWFECTARETDSQTDRQIREYMDKRMRQFGYAFDAFCSQHVGDTVRAMEIGLINHLRGWRPNAAVVAFGENLFEPA